MSSRASGGALAAILITAAIVGFAGGAYVGNQSGTTASGSESTSGQSESPGQDGSTNGEPDSEETDEEGTDEAGLSLSAGSESVSSSERIDLSGTVEPAEEGIALTLERSVDGGEWKTFTLNTPLTTNSDGSFSTWVQTGQTGENSFRVVREDDSEVVSDPVAVNVS